MNNEKTVFTREEAIVRMMAGDRFTRITRKGFCHSVYFYDREVRGYPLRRMPIGGGKAAPAMMVQGEYLLHVEEKETLAGRMAKHLAMLDEIVDKIVHLEADTTGKKGQIALTLDPELFKALSTAVRMLAPPAPCIGPNAFLYKDVRIKAGPYQSSLKPTSQFDNIFKALGVSPKAESPAPVSITATEVKECNYKRFANAMGKMLEMAEDLARIASTDTGATKLHPLFSEKWPEDKNNPNTHQVKLSEGLPLPPKLRPNPKLEVSAEHMTFDYIREHAKIGDVLVNVWGARRIFLGFSNGLLKTALITSGLCASDHVWEEYKIKDWKLERRA